MKAAFTKTLVWSSQVDIFNNARFTESNCIFECHTCFMHLPPPPPQKKKHQGSGCFADSLYFLDTETSSHLGVLSFSQLNEVLLIIF